MSLSKCQHTQMTKGSKFSSVLFIADEIFKYKVIQSLYLPDRNHLIHSQTDNWHGGSLELYKKARVNRTASIKKILRAIRSVTLLLWDQIRISLFSQRCAPKLQMTTNTWNVTSVMCVRDAGDYQVLQGLFANVILCLIFNLMGVDVFCRMSPAFKKEWNSPS